MKGSKFGARRKSRDMTTRKVFRIDGTEIGDFDFREGTGPKDLYGNLDLSNANLEDFSFKFCSLRNANFDGANLKRARFEQVDALRATFKIASLFGAYFANSTFEGVDFQGANLYSANFRCVDLTHADLRNANLTEVDFNSVRADGMMVSPFQVPQDVELIVWKQLCYGLICKLRIPAEAKRTASIVGRKCRAECAEVLEIRDSKGQPVEQGFSLHRPDFCYEVGKMIRPDEFNSDYLVECRPGIHFFRTEEEARNYCY